MVSGVAAFYMMIASYVFVGAGRDFYKIRQYPTSHHSTYGYVVMTIFALQFVCGFYRRETTNFEIATQIIHAVIGWLIQIVGGNISKPSTP